MELNHFTINVLSLGHSLEGLIPPPGSREGKEAPEGLGRTQIHGWVTLP